ncbi:MAG: homoserine dehydrogenase [Thermoanaerobaculia bacterium]
MTMLDRLARLEDEIRIAIIGVGAMGKGLLHQSTLTPGIRCVAIADIRIEAAIAAAKETGLPWRGVDSLAGLHGAIAEGSIAVTADGDLLARCELVDALVEASSSITPAARFAITAIDSGKHLALMNSEIDLIFGPYLLALARRRGVTYASCDGDQHGVIRHLIDELRLWGFELVMGGNIKGFLDRYSDPVKIIPEADKRNLDYRMATAYTDGTKLSIEMSLLANAFGLRTLVPGMQGPRAKHVREALDLFDLEAIRAGGSAVVDYILGAEPDGGVFAVGYCDNAYQRSMLSYYKMGRGPFYLLYRPYHLCHVEAMAGIAAACLDGESLLQPDHGFRTNVIAYAKRDLRAGETLDGPGGFTCYGQIENCPGNSPGLPVCLADGITLRRDVARDERIAFADVLYDPARFDFDLYSKALAATEAP